MRSLTALIGVLLFLLATNAAAAPGENWFRAIVNHVDSGLRVLVYVDAAGHQYLRQLDLVELGIPLSGGPRYRHAAEWYYRFDELPAHEARTNDIDGRLHLVSRRRPHIEAPPGEMLLLQVNVNGRDIDEPQLLRFRQGEIVLSESALAAIGINEEKARVLLKQDDALPVHAIAGENFVVDYSNLSLDMTVPPELFRPVRIGVSKLPEPADPAPGVSVMLGYDITTGVEAERENWQAGLFELAVGTATSTCLSQHVMLAETGTVRRMDSRCIFDWPSKMLSLGIGDAITRPGSAGQAVRYGGIRLGTDYGLAPAFVTQPTLALLGSARVPSTLEVWVDQMLALRQEIQPGVYELDDIPVHTGAGEIRAVVTNALGVREVISHAFYSDPSLLAAGLSDWSAELGRLREDYVQETDHYGERFALFNLRYGLANWLTLAPRLEATDQFRTASLAAAFRIGRFGVFEVAGSASRTAGNEQGTASALAFSRRGRRLSVNLSHSRSDETFVQLGYPEPSSAPATLSRAGIGASLGGGISMNVGGFERSFHDGERQRFHTAAMNFRIGSLGHLLLSVFEPVEPANEPMYSAHFTMPLGGRSNLSSSIYRQGRIEGRQAAVQRNLSSGPGFGYRAATSDVNGSLMHSVDLAVQGEAARLRIDARNAGNSTSGQVQLSGSVLASANGLHLTRWREGSAAIVELPAENVRIYHEERVAAVTGTNGKAVIPGLRPYQANRLRIETDDLPLDSAIRSSDMRLTPGRRQALVAKFEVTRSQHVSAKLRLAANGQAVPAGAVVSLLNRGETFPVGYDGLIYLPVESQVTLRLFVEWPAGSCEADLPLTESSDAFVDAGHVQCRER